MTASDTMNRAVHRLQSVLQSKHAVLPVDTLDKLCEAEDCVSLAGARAVIGRQFDHRAELMILDPRLGTFGLVHELKPQTTTADIRRLIEHAAFTRHLVLSRWLDEGDGLSHRRLPLTVELWDPLESTCRHASLSIL